MLFYENFVKHRRSLYSLVCFLYKRWSSWLRMGLSTYQRFRPSCWCLILQLRAHTSTTNPQHVLCSKMSSTYGEHSCTCKATGGQMLPDNLETAYLFLQRSITTLNLSTYIFSITLSQWVRHFKTCFFNGNTYAFFKKGNFSYVRAILNGCQRFRLLLIVDSSYSHPQHAVCAQMFLNASRSWRRWRPIGG